MSKVFVVSYAEYDRDDPYSSGFECIEGVFDSKEKVIMFILEKYKQIYDKKYHEFVFRDENDDIVMTVDRIPTLQELSDYYVEMKKKKACGGEQTFSCEKFDVL